MSKFDSVLSGVKVEQVTAALCNALSAQKLGRKGERQGPDYSVQLRAVELWKGIQEAALKAGPGEGPSQDLAEHWAKVRELQARQSRVS